MGKAGGKLGSRMFIDQQLPSKMKQWLLRLSIVGSLLMGSFASRATPVKGKLELKRPNILLILADDVGTGDIPGYWKDTGKVDMPNIADLVSKGTLFTDAHSTPLCAPTRYVLLSGNYQHRGSKRSGTWSIGTHSQFKDGQKSIAQVLRDGGNYHTGMFGKWHLGGVIPVNKTGRIKPKTKNVIRYKGHDWTLPLGQGPQDIGFDSSLITSGGIQSPPYVFLRDGYIATDASDIDYWEKGSYAMPEGISIIGKAGEGAPDWDSTAYNMKLVNETIDFLDEHLETRPKDPFFTYVALGSVHVPHSPPFIYLDGSPVAGEYETAHMDVLGEMDKAVGSLVQALEDRNLLQDTIIIFTSDNGGLTFSMNYSHVPSGPLRAHKGSIYEGGHRVPLIMRYDGVFPAQKNRTHLVGLNDLFATLCELAGVKIPKKQARDSVSFAKYIIDGVTDGLREFLGMWRYNGKSKRWAGAIRKNNFKLIGNFSTQAFELYNLDEDISESNNLISAPFHQELRDEMLMELNRIGPFLSCFGQRTFKIKAFQTRKCCSWARKRRWKRCKRYSAVCKKCPTLCV